MIAPKRNPEPGQTGNGAYQNVHSNYSSVQTRKLPAYGKKLLDVIQNPNTWPGYSGTSPDGQHLTIWIAIGAGAWIWARERIGTGKLIIVIPPDDAPEQYRYEYVRGHDPILIQVCGEVSGDFIQSVVAALARDGAQRVLVLAENGSTLYREASA